MKKFRIEKDALGKINVPKDAYYGIETQRAINNFSVSGQIPYQEYTFALVLIKKAAAKVNYELKLLDKKLSQTIIAACNEILSGKFSDQFVVDPYQAGAGTSQHMNINEVIANRANEILGAKLGIYRFIDPHDHVNMSQSTNDVIPTAIRLSALKLIPLLISNLKGLINAFSDKEQKFSKLIKTGRTHLQDALPVTLGQEFSGYKTAIINDLNRIDQAKVSLLRIGIGGTAVGTGINTHPRYKAMMIKELSSLTAFHLISPDNLFESMQNTADFLHLSAALRTLAQTLIRIGNDLRLLSSGPSGGIAEIKLPPVQEGSSIMPGKINPSIVEMLTMVCFQVIGLDQTILLSSMSGQLELNIFLPLIAHNILTQIKFLTNAIEVFTKKCVIGIEANDNMCKNWFEKSTGVAAVLNPKLGYRKTAELVKKSLAKGIPIRNLVRNKKIFSPSSLTTPNIK